MGIAKFALVLLLFAHLNCPEDGTMLAPTGAVRVSSGGHLMHEYRCLQGHTFWLQK